MKRFTLLVLLAALLAGCGDTPVPAETTVPEASADRLSCVYICNYICKMEE